MPHLQSRDFSLPFHCWVTGKNYTAILFLVAIFGGHFCESQQLSASYIYSGTASIQCHSSILASHT